MRRRQAKKVLKSARSRLRAGFRTVEKASRKFATIFSREICRADLKDADLGVRTHGLAARRSVLGKIKRVLGVERGHEASGDAEVWPCK